MASEGIRNLIQVRRGYSMNYDGLQIGNTPLDNKWTAGIQLKEGEIGYELDTGKFKIGRWDTSSNGLTTWANLNYAGGDGFIPGSGIGILPNDGDYDTLYSILKQADNDTNITIEEADISTLISGATGTYYKLGLADNLTNINNITSSGMITANTAQIESDLTVGNDVTISGDLSVMGDTVSFSSATITLVNLSATSGNFTNDLTVGGVDVSLDGHQHVWTDMDLSDANEQAAFCSSVGDCVNTQMSGVSGVLLSYSSVNDILSIGLTGEALAQHQINSNGIITRTGNATYSSRSLVSGDNINIIDGNGVAGNPTIGLVSDVSGLNSLIVSGLRLDSTKITTVNADGNMTIESSGTGTVYLNNVAISGGYINDVTIGNTVSESGSFTKLTIDNIVIDNNTISRSDSGGDLTIGDADDNVKISGALYLNGTQITSSALELNYVDITAIGSAQASKALVLDANKEITGISKLYSTELYMDSKLVATQEYVDAVKQGLDIKDSVRVATISQVGSYTSTGGTKSRGQITGAPNSVDGINLAPNDRILVKNNSTSLASNGIYVVTTVGTGANGVWDRAEDFDDDSEVTAGAFTFVEEGDTNADSGWVLTTNDPITIGGIAGTSLSFAQFSGAGQITAGSGLVKDGNTINIASTGGTIAIVADSIDLAAVDPTSSPGSNGVSFVQSVSVDSYGRTTDVTTATVRDATTTSGTKGIASFNSTSFSLTSGHVSIATGGISNSQLANSSINIGTDTISLGNSPAQLTLSGLTSVSSTSFVGDLSGNADTATSATNSTNAINVDITQKSDNANYQLVFAPNDSTGYSALSIEDSTTRLTYNPSTQTLTCANFSGTATNALNIEVDTSSANINHLVFVNGTDGNLKPVVNSNLKFDAANNILYGTNYNTTTTPTSKIEYFIIDGGAP